MVKKDVLQIRFPVGGVTRRTAIQQQSPYVCYDALNVFPDCTFLERERGGHRPGTRKAHSSFGHCNLIAELGYIDANGTLERELLMAGGGKLKGFRKTTKSFNTTVMGLHTGRVLTGGAMQGKYFIARGDDPDESLMVYDPIAATLTKVSDDAGVKGTVPIKSKMCLSWRDRIVLADGESPNEIFMSRQGDPYDWDFTATDLQAAVSLSATHAGWVGQPVKALIPHTENCLLIVTESEWYALRGDVSAGGRITLITDVLGILGRRAWCHSPDGFLWTMTSDGLYVMPPGCGDPLYSVSREKLPAELVNYDPAKYSPSMAYCHRTRGVFVFMTELKASQGSVKPPFCGTVVQGSKAPDGSAITVTHFFVDIRNSQSNDSTNKYAASFWPISMHEAEEPTYALSGHTVDDEPAAYFGTKSAGIIYFDRREKTVTKWVPTDGVPVADESGGPFNSYVMFGPFINGAAGRIGLIEQIRATLGFDSKPVEWEIYGGDDAESPLYGKPLDSGEWVLSGANFTTHVRIRCKYFWVLIRSRNKEPWAFEGMQVIRQHRSGRDRIEFDEVVYSAGVPIGLANQPPSTLLAIVDPSFPEMFFEEAITPFTVTANNGTTPYVFSIVDDSLPAGLSINDATGEVTGTPTAIGTGSTIFRVTDDVGDFSDSSLIPWEVQATSLMIDDPAYPDMTVGTAIATITIVVYGGMLPYSFSVSAGSLPAGLSLNSSTGKITGTPTTAGTGSTTFRVTDGLGYDDTSSINWEVIELLSIADPTFPVMPINAAITPFSVVASDGWPAYTYSVIGGALPAGLSLNPSTGQVSGTPTVSGTGAVTFRVTDQKSYTATTSMILWEVFADLTISDPAFPSMPEDQAITPFSLVAAGGVPDLVYSVQAGALPAGLSLDPDTGEVSGTPTTVGTGSVTFRVTDDVSDTADTSSIDWEVESVLSIADPSFPVMPEDVAISGFFVVAASGTPPYTYSVQSGALPTGLSLNASTGEITGTPTTPGTGSVVFRVTDDVAETADTNSIDWEVFADLTIDDPAFVVMCETFAITPINVVGNDGVPPLVYSVQSGALPAGLSLNSSTGVVSGTPTADGTGNVTFRVTDAVADTADSSSIPWEVTVQLTVANPTYPSMPVDTVITPFSVVASGGSTPYTYSVQSGSLPTGLSLNSGTGEVSGTPTVPGSGSTIFRATDDEGYTVDTSAIGWTVFSDLEIANPTFPAMQNTTAITTFYVVASEGTPPYTYSVQSGALPAGLSLNASTGAITGTPTTPGTGSVTFRVTDDLAATADTSSIPWEVNTKLTIADPSFPTMFWEEAITPFNVVASNGDTPYVYSVFSGALPAGLSLNSSTGAVSGTPTAVGSGSVRFRATDDDGFTATTTTIYWTVNIGA